MVDMSDVLKEVLVQVNEELGEPPRKLRRSERRVLQLRKPLSLRLGRDRRFDEIFKYQKRLLVNGRAVWGALIQANVLLFEPGPDDCPAAILYSTDPQMDPILLQEVASTLMQFKGKRVKNRELQHLGDHLKDEYVVDMKYPIPKDLTDGFPCYYTCIWVQRSHIAGGVLRGRLFPLLALPEETEATMVVHHEFWPDWFTQHMWS